MHVCEICGETPEHHRQPEGEGVFIMLPPCCIGCGCGTGEEYIASKTKK